MQEVPSFDDPAQAAARVVEGAVALARAEAKLLVSEARALGKRGAVIAGAGVAGLAFTQVALILLALVPVLTVFRPWPIVLLAVAPAFILAGVAWWTVLRNVRALVGARARGEDRVELPITAEFRRR
jgi:hypothetical protein